MCGIVGAVAQRDVAEILLTGLQRLEYRGYDSAGMAVINHDQEMMRLRTQGKVSELARALQQQPLLGHCGIAHTRWATHGVPAEHNAHPHVSNEQIAIVHNGIIENHQALRRQLIEKGYTFTSDTDSEIIAHLIHDYMQANDDFIDVLHKLGDALHGAFALGIVDQSQPNTIYAIRKGSPLVVGLGIGENYLASDQIALAGFANRFVYLSDGDLAKITLNKIEIFDAQGHRVEREEHAASEFSNAVDKGEYRHYMQKEIFEQPKVMADTLEGRISTNKVFAEIFGSQAQALFAETKAIHIVACGTSYHAGMVAKYWLEGLAGVPCNVEIASEYRYRNPIVAAGTLFVTISQSGETADTLAALEHAKQKSYIGSLAICNVPSSSLVRESDLVLMTRAGAEIGVASTKAFTTQLTALLLFTLVIGEQNHMDAAAAEEILQQLQTLPELAKEVLTLDRSIASLAPNFSDKQHALFLGRGVHYPVALEGALKLKEISYIHAEAYPAGELKHGPLALVDQDMPVITVAPNDELLEKLKSNLEEVRARGGQLYVFADKAIDIAADDNIIVTQLPSVSKYLAPIIYTIPLQLLAYHIAVIRGTDIDQPRNLAKSVTVE